MKKKNRNILFLFTAAVILFALAVVAESVYFSDYEYHFRTKRFNKILHEKEKVLEDCLNGMKPVLARGEPHGSVSENKVFLMAEENEITLLEYIDNKLFYWSDNGFDVPKILDDSLYAKPILFLKNGWFLPLTVKEANETVVGLLRIRTDYGFENDIIKSGFEKDFKMPASVGCDVKNHSSEYRVSDNKGLFLFSLTFPEDKSNSIFILLPLVLWTLLFLLVIIISLRLNTFLAGKGRPLAGILSCLLIFIAIYLPILLLKKPASVFVTGLFSPYIFSLNALVPSLGHLLIISILLFILSFVLYKYIPGNISSGKNPIAETFIMIILLACGAVLISLFHSLFSQLVSDSNINFETYKVLKLSFFSLAGFVTVILMSLVPLLLILTVFRIYKHAEIWKVLLSVAISICIIAAILFNDKWSMAAVALFYTGLVFLIWIEGWRNLRIFNMVVIFSVILGLYSLFVITRFAEKKTTENLKVQALSFSTENDPEAEHLLLDMWPLLKNDGFLNGMMNVSDFRPEDIERITTYVHEAYFTGYWGNFNFNLILCPQDRSLRLENENKTVNCFDYFNERITKYGHKLTGTDFYFIDNQGGRSYYLGNLEYKVTDRITNEIFIELYSNVNVFQPGYSELLIDKKFHGYSELRDYSFAKYINGEIVLKSGEFAYDKNDDNYIDKDSDYRIFNGGMYRHVLFKNGNATVIISRPRLTTGDIIISFAYLFAFIFIFTNLMLLVTSRPAVRRSVNLNFRQKLQMSFIGILLFSFILVGTVVAFLTISEYRSKHYDNVKEKLNSIYFELDNKLSSEKRLSTDWRNPTNSSLNELLINLSNIFNTDINLYDLYGFLMATSRPEIYYRNLAGHRMNNQAYINLSYHKKSEYLQTEQVGNMKYISEYVPFYNTENNVTAYVNIPYFRMQSLLAREISNLIVAVINFTLLLILITMSLAVFISGRLTSPLSMLSGGLASVTLGKKSEHLSYKGNDEIGELVKQYNRMVDELEESASKLANSEREYAWREMAKQIAHEIKNPLTPMKLNVQQLLKSWKDKAPGFEDKIETFSKSQVEYIDDLSSIASAFSSFAKLPGTILSEVNLPDQVKTTLELFKDTENIEFRIKLPRESKVIIYADKEHINGIFSNLIKNSIQAIPAGSKGVINLLMEVSRDKVLVSVSDNGSGIPLSLRKKMFTPNFTTKSSGTGLGLSIVKKYVEEANGRIWFESETDKGATFFMEFPLKYTVEKPGNSNPA
jgi:two-component system, NtrC family, nitrogen regulation sensor histidine kinase NtrY